MDHLIYLDAGEIKVEGTYTHLRTSGLDFTNLLKNETNENPEEEEQGSNTEFRRRMSSKVVRDRQDSVHSATSIEVTAPQEVFFSSYQWSLPLLDENLLFQVEEQQSSGSVSSKVYAGYFKAGGNGCTIVLTFLFFLVSQGIASLIDYFITFW